MVFEEKKKNAFRADSPVLCFFLVLFWSREKERERERWKEKERRCSRKIVRDNDGNIINERIREMYINSKVVFR